MCTLARLRSHVLPALLIGSTTPLMTSRLIGETLDLAAATAAYNPGSIE